MESAFTYLQSLVDAFEDVGKGERGEKKNDYSSSTCHETGLPSCALDVTNSAEDQVFSTNDIDAMERQQLPRSAGFNDEDKYNENNHEKIRKSSSYQSSGGKRGRRDPPIKQTFSDRLKSKTHEVASRISLLQSFSGSNNPKLHGDPPGLKKSISSISSKTNDTSTVDADAENEDLDLVRTSSLSSNNNPSKRAMRSSSKRSAGSRGQRHELKTPPKEQYRHFEWCAHGLIWTCLAITFGWAGFGMSIVARQSTDFVALKSPMYLDPRYEKIPTVGMIQLELCFNETHLDILEELKDDDDEKFVLLDMKELKPQSRLFDEPVTNNNGHTYPSHGGARGTHFAVLDEIDDTPANCIIHRLTSDDVNDDVMYKVSQSVAFLAIVFGGFVTIFLTSSVFWKTINLRPIGMGYLVAYFLQSFTFLIFDSSLCKDNEGCTMSQGGIYSAIASVCWIISCAASARMDNRKFRNEQKESEERRDRIDRVYKSNMRKARKAAEPKPRPREITISKATQPNNGSTRRPSSRSESPDKQHLKRNRPKSMNVRDRANTAETAITHEDVSAPLSQDNYESSYRSEGGNRSRRRSSQKPKKKRSTTNLEGNKSTHQEVEEPIRSKSTSMRCRTTEDATGESSTSMRTRENRKQSQRSRSQSQRRERSNRKIRKMDFTGDVTEANRQDSRKSLRRGSTRIITSPPSAFDFPSEEEIRNALASAHLQQNPTKERRRSSSRPRKGKSSANDGKNVVRGSVRQPIDGGKHYEL